MIYGVYFCFGGLVFLLGLFLFERARLRLWRYTLISLLLGIAAMAAFTLISNWMGILRFGSTGSHNYPNDYLSHGPLGWAAMALLLLGVLSPLVAAYLAAASKRDRHLS